MEITYADNFSRVLCLFLMATSQPSSLVSLQCAAVNDINVSLRCEFVNVNKDCCHARSNLPYLEFLYCTFGENAVIPPMCILAIWLLVLFTGLGVTADDFLCPSLIVISKTLRLSQNIAGVTFLAFGNGAPDIFSSIAGVRQSKPELVFGELFGAGIFVTCVVAGSICLSQSFKVMERPLLRDVIFYVWAAFTAFYVFFSQRITIFHAIGFIAVYVVYILVVVLSRVINQRQLAQQGSTSSQSDTTSSSKTESSEESPPPPPPPPPPTIAEFWFSFRSSLAPPRRKRTLSTTSSLMAYLDNPSPRKRTLSSSSTSKHQKEQEEENTENPRPLANGSTRRSKKEVGSAPTVCVIKISDEDDDKKPQNDYDDTPQVPSPPPFISQQSTTSISALVDDDDSARPLSLWKELWYHICPIDIEGWEKASWYFKIVYIFRAPVYFILTIITPAVDYESEKDNWCRLLNVFHCLSGPLFLACITGKLRYSIGGVFPIWALVLIIGLVLATIVFFTSRDDEPPRYHWAFGYLGFVVSVGWVYTFATEIVSLLQAVGVVFGISDAILGLTVLAWGNSIGDFIANLSVAKQGFPRMGISACFGSPLLNLLLGVGLPYTYLLAESGETLTLKFSRMMSLMYTVLTISLISTLVVMTALKFQVKRWYGGYLIGLYVIFIIIAVLFETGIV